MSLYWLQPGWNDARCCVCGKRIAPEGDPEWGRCYEHMKQKVDADRAEDQYIAQMEEEYINQLIAEQEPTHDPH